MLISAQSGRQPLAAPRPCRPISAGASSGCARIPGRRTLRALYYAHVDFNGADHRRPKLVIGIPRIAFRGHYYFAAWNADHFGLLISDQRDALLLQHVDRRRAVRPEAVVGPPLFVDPQFDQESDGDLDAFPGGFLGVIEGECDGHSCSYAFKLDTNGNALGASVNLVDFDFTHQFYPRAAFDGAGFAILSVKDIQISERRRDDQVLAAERRELRRNAKVVPAKQYLWDEFPDIAWNGDHFAALWTENSARSHTAPWQIHFASFRRTKTASTLIARPRHRHGGAEDQPPLDDAGASRSAATGSRSTRAARADNSDRRRLRAARRRRADARRDRAVPAHRRCARVEPAHRRRHVGELGIARGSVVGDGTTDRILHPRTAELSVAATSALEPRIARIRIPSASGVHRAAIRATSAAAEEGGGCTRNGG